MDMQKAISSAWIVTILLAFILNSPALATYSPRQKPLLVKVGAYANRPKIFMDKNGRIAGFWPDLIAIIAKEENWKIKYVWGSWADGLRRLKNREIDIMPDVGFTKKRARLYTFSRDPVIMSWARLYISRDSPEIKSIQDLNNKKIAALRGSVNFEGPDGLKELVRAFNLHCSFLELDSYPEVFKAVEEHRADAGITNRNFGNKNAGRFKVKKTPIIFQPINIKFAFPKNGELTPLLVNRINYHMKKFKQDQDSPYYKLLGKYFEAEIAEKKIKVLPRWLYITMEAFSAMLVLFALAAILSRIQVKKKTREIQAKNRALRISEQKYREMFDSPADAIFILDISTGKILDANRAVKDVYGYSREEMLRLKTIDISSGIHPYTQQQALKLIRKTVAEGPQTFEWRAKRKNGDLFWVEVGLKYTEIRDEKYVIAVVRDVEARKRAEKELLAEKERLAVTLASIGDGVIATDTSSRIVLINKVAAELTGWRRKEAIGRQATDVLRTVEEKTGKPCTDPVQRIMYTGGASGFAHRCVLEGRNGVQRIIAENGAPILDTEGRIIGIVLVFRDITERIRMEQEMLKNEKLRSVGLLAGGIAHDFNNILTTIMGNIDLAAHIVGRENRVFPLLEEADKASLRAKDLTMQLLTFAKGGEPVRKTASIAKIIRESTEFVLHGSNIACRFQIPDDLWLVKIDTGQMSQVVQNLAINARQAMPEGGTIHVTCSNIADVTGENINGLPDRKYIKIIFRDNGQGIPKKIIGSVFDPYFSTKKKGSGLGLAIVHSIISKHDGHIRVESKSGKGTTFTIYLPAVPGREAKTTEPASGIEPVDMKILVMDDEEMIRELTQGMLEHLGCEVVLASDGAEAIDLYRRLMDSGRPVDAVIMDLTIPGGMGGREAVQELLKIDPQARVIVSSGYSNDPVMADYAKYGFRAAVAKPFTLSELRKAIGLVL